MGRDNALPNSFLKGRAEISVIRAPKFGEKADSGSIVLDATSPTAVGLLWAGASTRAFISPITLVEQRLNISVVW